VSDHEIPKTKVAYTIVGSKIVYDAAANRP
jgi:hypothetical protein